MPKKKKNEVVLSVPKPEDVLEEIAPVQSQVDEFEKYEVPGGFEEVKVDPYLENNYQSKLVVATMVTGVFIGLGYLLLGLLEFVKYLMLQLTGYTWLGKLINKIVDQQFGEGREEVLLEFPILGIGMIFFLITSILILYHTIRLRSSSINILRRLVVFLLFIPFPTLLFLFFSGEITLSADIFHKDGLFNPKMIAIFIFLVVLPIITISILIMKRDEFNDNFTEVSKRIKIFTYIYILLLIFPVFAVISVGYSKYIYNPDNYNKIVSDTGQKVYEPTYMTYELFQTFPFQLIEEDNRELLTVEYHPSSFRIVKNPRSIYLFQINVGRGASLIPLNADEDFYEDKVFVDISIAKEGEAYIDTSYSKELSKDLKRIQFISQDGIHIQLEVDDTGIPDDELVKMANSMKSR